MDSCGERDQAGFARKMGLTPYGEETLKLLTTNAKGSVPFFVQSPSRVLLDLQKVSRNFGRVQALREVTLRLETGTVGLVGNNSEGKIHLIEDLARIFARVFGGRDHPRLRHPPHGTEIAGTHRLYARSRGNRTTAEGHRTWPCRGIFTVCRTATLEGGRTKC